MLTVTGFFESCEPEMDGGRLHWVTWHYQVQSEDHCVAVGYARNPHGSHNLVARWWDGTPNSDGYRDGWLNRGITVGNKQVLSLLDDLGFDSQLAKILLNKPQRHAFACGVKAGRSSC